LLRCGRRLGPLISAGSLSVDVDGDADATRTETDADTAPKKFKRQAR
jgi:hypothetical protein